MEKIKMMFKGEDHWALQTLLNNMITPLDLCTPTHALNAIQTHIKEDKHYWHFSNEVLSYFWQLPNKGIHTLNTKIPTLINNCKFQHKQTKETIKIMLLQ